MVSLDRYNGSCNTLGDPSGRICVLNKKEDMHLHVFDMVTKKASQKH